MYTLLLAPGSQAKDFYSDQSAGDDSGFDIFFPFDRIVPKNFDVQFVNMDIKCEMIDDQGCSRPFWVVPRSSISKTPVRLANQIGIIDKMYRGDIKLALENGTKNFYQIQKGDRLFQIILPSGDPFQVRVVDIDELSKSDRGGHGSTGKNCQDDTRVRETLNSLRERQDNQKVLEKMFEKQKMA